VSPKKKILKTDAEHVAVEIYAPVITRKNIFRNFYKVFVLRGRGSIVFFWLYNILRMHNYIRGPGIIKQPLFPDRINRFSWV
jgi:hypothetical protein